MARQLCCRGMCKNLSRSEGQQRNYNKTKFPSNLNSGQKTLVKRAPGGVSLTLRELTKIISRKYTRTKFQLEIHIRSTISAMHKFGENIFESSRNVSETPPRCQTGYVLVVAGENMRSGAPVANFTYCYYYYSQIPTNEWRFVVSKCKISPQIGAHQQIW